MATLLKRSGPLTGAQVAKACPSASEMGVRKALGRLAASGLVLNVPGGYILNREHLVFPAVEQLDGLYGLLRERIRGAVQAWGGKVSSVGLFGSAARRDGDSDSDIDVLLVSNDPTAEDFALELSDLVRRWTGNECQTMALTERELRRMKRAGEPIVNEWLSELDPVIGSIDDVLTSRKGSTRSPSAPPSPTRGRHSPLGKALRSNGFEVSVGHVRMTRS